MMLCFRSNVVFAILFCVVQNKFVYKAIHWGFFWLGIVKGQYVLAVIIRKIRLVVSYFGEVEMSKEVSFLDRHVKFPYRELRRSHITLYKDCDSILLSLDFLSKQ